MIRSACIFINVFDLYFVYLSPSNWKMWMKVLVLVLVLGVCVCVCVCQCWWYCTIKYTTTSLLWSGLLDIYNINPLTPNDLYISRTTPLTSKCCILYIYSTNVGTEYFKHALNSPSFFLFKMQFFFIMLTCLFPVLFTFYIQCVLK